MKIEIKNFGPISSFEFDLNKDFHLIVGENNVGKSYAITAVYIILKSLLNSSGNSFLRMNRYLMPKHAYRSFLINDVVDYSFVLKSLEKLKNKKDRKEVTFEKETAKSLKLFFSEFFLPELADSLKNSFNSISNLSNQFSGEPFSIRLITEEYSVTLLQHNNELAVDAIGFQKKIILRKVKQNRNVRKTDTLITLYYNENETDDGEKGFLHAYSVFIANFYYDLLKTINRLIADIHYLPASRSGLYQALSAFGQIVAELSKSRAFLTKKIELPNISEPLSDYFLKLTEIKVNKRSFEEKPVNKIAEEIETDILRGQVEFDPKTKKIFFMPEGTNLRLDLSATSSMVSELSPIVSFLRYVITATPTSGRHFIRKKSGKIDREKLPKHLMMIEEPEAHLHPEIQLKMTEAFSRLVGAGVKIVITTHSNYIFNKVNNLILDKRFSIGNMSSKVFKTTDKGSEGIELSADDLGIEDENFIDVSEQLYNEKIELIEKLNQHD